MKIPGISNASSEDFVWLEDACVNSASIQLFVTWIKTTGVEDFNKIRSYCATAFYFLVQRGSNRLVKHDILVYIYSLSVMYNLEEIFDARGRP